MHRPILLLCFALVEQSASCGYMYSSGLPHWHMSAMCASSVNLMGMGKMDKYLTTTKHNKVESRCIFHGMHPIPGHFQSIICAVSSISSYMNLIIFSCNRSRMSAGYVCGKNNTCFLKLSINLKSTAEIKSCLSHGKWGFMLSLMGSQLLFGTHKNHLQMTWLINRTHTHTYIYIYIGPCISHQIVIIRNCEFLHILMIIKKGSTAFPNYSFFTFWQVLDQYIWYFIYENTKWCYMAW